LPCEGDPDRTFETAEEQVFALGARRRRSAIDAEHQDSVNSFLQKTDR